MKMFFLKNRFWSLLFVFTFTFVFAGVVYALNTWSTGYRINTETKAVYVSSSQTCYGVTNASANSFFIPTKTTTEWNAFAAHLPSGVTFGTPADGDCDTDLDGFIDATAGGSDECDADSSTITKGLYSGHGCSGCPWSYTYVYADEYFYGELGWQYDWYARGYCRGYGTNGENITGSICYYGDGWGARYYYDWSMNSCQP